ncbi:LysR family transcriptional regulator [Bacillus thuringiensis]|uniref:LysR family transcriptional regulator n=1 Tax=Bacillus thuringiensis TaxID=1428 RepID=UPI000BF39B3E|nr:LysR family transcriptional regulator [Bacillus thuringiensis]PFU39980.1 LysR family transcriptional regulator [Bacillus thuringiensis]
MNIEQLKLIVTLSEERKLSRVAKKLNLTPSAVCQGIKKLEKELNTPLFNRTKDGTYPTVEGLHIIKNAYDALEKIDEIFEYTKDKRVYPKLRMKIAVVPGVIPPLVEAISELNDEFPFVEVEITQGKTQQVFTLLQLEQVDCALIIDSDDIKNKNFPFNIRKVCNGKLYIAMNRNSKLSLYNPLNYKTLIKEPLVLYKDEYILNYVKYIENKTGEHSNILFQTNNTNSIIYAVKNNFANTIALDFTFDNKYRDFYNEIKQVPIEDDENWKTISLWFCYPIKSNSTEITDTFFQLFDHYINNL